MERGERVQTGTLKVSESVLATIVKCAALEVEGVESLAHSSPRNISSVKALLNKNTQKGSIRIRLVGDVVEIAVRIIVKHGHNVVSIAEEIQNNVKSSVQTMTGIAVAVVNVQIAGVVFEDLKND